MADFTEMFERLQADRKLLAAVDEHQRMRLQIADLCEEVGRLQRENQILRDQLKEETDATAAYQAWLKAIEQAARQ